ncbi:MAG: outer membrane beta-barrel protein [Daejeonella sp.]
MKTLLLQNIAIFFLLFNYQPLEGQVSKIKLKGRIMQDAVNPAKGATISLMFADGSLAVKSLTDSLGNFELSAAPGSYIVTASLLGYKISSGKVILKMTPRVQQYNVLLIQDIQGLNEVTVRGTKPYIERRPGKIILNIGNSLTAPGNNAFDILIKAPGIQGDQNDNLIMNGRAGTIVAFDGKPQILSAEEIASLLRNIQADAISQIELISNPGARYDAAGSAGIINIRFKKEENAGTNGSVNTGFGYGETYKFNSGISLNNRSKRINLFGSYNYSNNERPERIFLDRNVNLNNFITNFNVHNEDNKLRKAHDFKTGLDYFLNSKQTIGMMLTGFFNDMRSLESNSSVISNNSIVDSTIYTSSDENRRVSNVGYNINYKALFDPAGKELSVDLDYLGYRRSSAEQIDYSYLNRENIPYREKQYFRNSSPSAINGASVKINYSHPLSKTAKFDSGIKSSNINSNNTRNFDQLLNNNWRDDLLRSSQFSFSEQIHAAYINFSNKFKNTSVELGLRAEQTVSEGKVIDQRVLNRNYLNFFPAFQVSQQLNKKNTLGLSYSRRIGRPGYEDLNPFYYFLDQYTYREGNPFLKPELTSTLELSHSLNEKFTTTLRYSFVKDVMMNINEQNDVTKVNKSVRRNLESQQNWGIEVYTPFEITKWWSATATAQAYYQQFKSVLGNVPLNNSKPYFLLNLQQNFSFKNKLSAEITGNFESSSAYGIFVFKPYYVLDAGLSKTLFKGKSILRLSLSDILNTNGYRFYTLYNNLDYYSREKRETRVASISFTYKFGKNSVKPARRRASGLEDESRRIRN